MMKVHSIDLCGFRGCRARLTLEFANGFTILTGSNGSGKSTIIDAIEFALIGAISKYEDTSGEKGEKSSDYEWWRGDFQPSDRYVHLVLQGEGAQRVEINRRPGSVEVTGAQNLLSALCDLSLNPEGSIEGLCRTSFIRDEFIASHSVDLPETDRFAFVRSAVGAQNTSQIQSKIQEARDEVGEQIKNARQEYTIARTRVDESIERLSTLRATSAQTTSETTETSSLRRTMGLDETTTVSDVLHTADREISRLRSQADVLGRLLSRAVSLQARLSSADTEQLKARRTRLENEIGAHRLSLEGTRQGIVESEQQYVQLRDGQEFILNLAELSKAGRSIGLRDGSCPLCGLQIDAQGFEKHVGEIEAEVSKFGSSIAAAVERRAGLRGIETVTRDQLESSERAYDSVVAELDSVDRQIALLNDEIVSVIPTATDWSPDVIRVEMEQAMKRLSTLERERRIFAAPSVMRDLLDQESDVKMKRNVALESEKLLSRLQRVDDQLKEALDAVKRFSAEAVEERLAAIKPLFTELYVRLRPHVDWKRVDYAVRGDLRKFLSLRVDHGLNMKFLFSSGQRRAAGLAFLISVALSRPWCRLRTLVLDDPIQHVDDFRAIHLVETLAAVRTSGYQMLCAVEDPNLAELLCRRLRSKYDEAGVLIEMKYVSGEGTQIANIRPVPPLGIALLAAS